MNMLKIDPVWQPETQQKHFRLLLDVMSRPGHCHALEAVPEDGPVALAVLASLLDAEVSLADPHGLLRKQDWPMLQAQAASPDMADFILCNATVVPDFTPRLGTLPNPEQSASLILVVKKLGQGDTCIKLTGPGIPECESLVIDGIAGEWLRLREDWVSAFPMGVDIILLDEQRIAALPRSTHVEVI